MKTFKSTPVAAAVALLAALAGPGQAAEHTWSSGNFVPGTTAPNPLPVGDLLFITTNSNKTFATGVHFENLGSVVWSAGAVFVQGGSSVLNNGLWSVQGNLGLTYSGSVGEFTNNGSYVKTAGDGFADVQVRFINNGLVQADSGTLRFTSSAHSFNHGSVFAGAGAVVVTSGSTFSGTYQSSNLELAAGTHTGVNAVARGTTAWSGGALTGTWTLDDGATLSLSSNGNKTLSGADSVFTNNGTVAQEAGSMFVQGGTQLVNNGVWDIHGNLGLTYSGSVGVFTNHGTLAKTAGDGFSDVHVATVNHGTVRADSGTLRFTSSGHSFNDGSQFTGAGAVVVSSSSSFTGAYQSSNLELAAGTHTGVGAVARGTTTWSGGTLTGGWTVDNGATLQLSSNSNKTLSGTGSVLTNHGTVAQAAGSMFVQGNTHVANNGLWELQGNLGLSYSGSVGVFTNHGTLAKTAGDGISDVHVATVNHGTVRADSGTLRFTSSGHSFNDGSQFTGAGAVVVSSSSSFTGAYQSSNLELAAGTHTGVGAVARGTTTWSGGTLTGGWAVDNGATLQLSSNSNKTLSGTGSVLTNHGTVAQAAGSMFVLGGTQLVNHGVWDVQGNLAITYSGSMGSVTNHGRFVKSAGDGVATVAPTFSNHGVVDVQTGTLSISQHNWANDGTLTGDARLQVSGTLNNRGTIAPGSFGAGTLTLASNLLQTADAVFAVDLTSLAEHDLLMVTGSASLAGTLALNCLGACSYEVGDVITILDAGSSLTGSFANVTLSGFATGAFDVIYDVANTAVRLQITEAVTAVPEPQTYAMLLAGLAAVGFLARRRRVAGDGSRR